MRREPDLLARRAAALAAGLARAARRAPAPGPAARLARPLLRARHGLVRHVRSVLREHWDVGAFDVAFGCLKAFGVYPALYFAGLAWAIPVMEYAPLNTQLWTAGYLFARRRLASALGTRRYGRSLEALDALRDARLGVQPRDARTVHRFALPEAPGLRCVRVRRSRLRAAWQRWLGRAPAPGLVTPGDLRRMLDDPELRFRAEPLRANPCLYERVLIEALLATPGGRARLAAASAPAPAEDATPLARLLGDGPEPVRALLEDDAARLARALRARPALARSPEGRALRRLHRAHRRALRRRLAAIADLEYRLLAQLDAGTPLHRCGPAAALRVHRRALEAHLRCAASLVERARLVAPGEGARRLVEACTTEARLHLGGGAKIGPAARASAVGPPVSAGCPQLPGFPFGTGALGRRGPILRATTGVS